MRVIFAGDFQTSVSNIPQCRIVVKQIIDLLKRNKAVHPLEKTFFVFLGDAREVMNPVDQRVTNFLVEAFLDIQLNCNSWFFVRGNHDNITINDDSPSCVPLIKLLTPQAVGDISWTISTLYPVDDKDVKLWTVPYFRDPARQLKAFTGAKESAARSSKAIRILAFHNEIRGCKRSTHSKGDGLTLEDIGADCYDICVGGHIHHPQLIGNNVYYAGSPFSMGWDEANVTHCFLEASIQPRRPVIIIPHSSNVPGWYDRSLPDFIPPKKWDGCHVRESVPVTLDPLKEMNEARRRLEAKYPGAILHLVPEYQNVLTPPEKIDLKGGDAAILRRYLEKLALPADVTVDQLVDYIQKFLPNGGVFGVQGLRFRQVEAWNVLSFEHVKLNLDREGLTLVTGKNLDWGESKSNGAGKSALTQLAFLALFGRTPKGQTNDEWARQEITDPAKIELSVELPNGDSLGIIRGRRPPVLRVFTNGREITMGDKNATQALIERITNLTWDVLTNSVYIGQREIGSVFGTDKERKELFSRLLGLDRFLEAWEKLRKISILRQRAVESVEVEVASVEAALTEAGSGLAEIEASLAEAPVVDPADLKTRLYEIQTLEANIRSNEQDSQKLEPTLEDNQAEFERLLERSMEAETVYRLLGDQINASTKVSGRCALCGNKVSVAALEKYTNELVEQQGKSNAAIEHFEILQESNRAVRKALIEKVQANRLANSKIQYRVALLQQESTKLKGMAEVRQRLVIIRDLKKARTAELTRRKEWHELAKMACLEEKQFVDICVKAMGRDGLPAYLCSVAAPQLNAAAARYSQIFSNGEIGLQFEISGGDIEVRVCNLHGGHAVKDQSSGELRMAALIAALSFRDALVSHNILVLDEPSEGLDAENAAAFAKGLNSVVEKFRHVIVISHNNQILEHLEPDFQIEVVKQNGISVATEK